MATEGVNDPADDNEKEYPERGPTTMLPALKLLPLTLKLIGPAVLPTQTMPKALMLVVLSVGVTGTEPQIIAGVALFLGAGVATAKSALLLFVSSHPLLLRIAAVVFDKAPVAAVSKQTDVPYPTRSIIEGPAGQPDTAVVPLINATRPFVPLMAIDGVAT